ncbi:MAG: restriction endonuclease subunit S [bacterium]|nr:restriction endonuclease subunit S [bacterium]
MGSEATTLGEFIDATGGSVQTGPFGTKLKASEYTEAGVPVISVGEVGFGRIRLHEKTPKVDSTVWERMPEFLLRTDDIVFGRKGAVERNAHIQPDEDGYFLGSDGIRVRLNSNNCDPRFISYQFQSAAHKAWMIQNAAGTTMPSLNEGIIRRIPIIVPPLPEQKAIAHILGTLDDKIELNRQMNATLEAMAQALFKSWFIDFDPVIDNALTAGNPIPPELAPRAKVRRLALANGTANREAAKPFPAAFQQTESMGWIPEEWEETSFGEHINFQTGPAFKSKDFTESGTRLARGDNVKEGRFQWGHKSRYWPTVDDSLLKYLLCSGDVLLGMDGSKVGKNRVRVRASDLPCLLVQRVARLSKKNTICSNFIFLAVNSERFRDYVEVVKTGSAIPHISGGQIKGLPLILPEDNTSAVFSEFERLASSFFNRTDVIVTESQTLTKLRDSLLPKLISGELRIPEVEQLTKGAHA